MFHRLTVPAYYGGLPGGYDYINNALVGTPAQVAGPSAAGPHTGTYFIGFGDDATSAIANRPLSALSENCDYLDDLMHRDLAVHAITVPVLAASPVSAITVTGPNIFVGAAGTPNTPDGIATFAQVVKQNGDPITDSVGEEVVITSITGATVGTEFSSGDVTFNVSPPIPTGTTYSVVYGTRSNIAAIPVDAFTRVKMRVALTAQETPYAGGLTWADGTANPGTTVEAQLDKIISDLRGTTLPTAGSMRIGSGPITPSFGPWSISAGPLWGQLSGIVESIGNQYNVRTFNSSGSLDPGGVLDAILRLNGTGAHNLTLPLAANNVGRRLILLDTNNAAMFVTLVPTGGDVIRGQTQLEVPYGIWDVFCDGTAWYVRETSDYGAYASAKPGAIYDLADGSVQSQLSELLGFHNDHAQASNTDHDGRYSLLGHDHGGTYLRILWQHTFLGVTAGASPTYATPSTPIYLVFNVTASGTTYYNGNLHALVNVNWSGGTLTVYNGTGSTVNINVVAFINT